MQSLSRTGVNYKTINCQSRDDCENYYSVPSKYAGTEVEVSLGIGIVRIYAQGQMVVMHNRSNGKGSFITRYC
ncbi:MAG: hypothetical protein H6911_02950 [Rickettsiaceae bacterium]|nr:hypothetical protein [Rickettsiaceae bacterium]